MTTVLRKCYLEIGLEKAQVHLLVTCTVIFFCIASDKPVRADVNWSLTLGLQVKASNPHATQGGTVVLQQISLLRMQHKTYSALLWPNCPWQLPC